MLCLFKPDGSLNTEVLIFKRTVPYLKSGTLYNGHMKVLVVGTYYDFELRKRRDQVIIEVL